jgi:hypothetical protein
VQAVSRPLPTGEARVRAWVRSCGICGGQSVLGFPPPILIPPTAPHSSSIIQGWYNRPINGVHTKWTQSHPTPRNKKYQLPFECALTVQSGSFCLAFVQSNVSTLLIRNLFFVSSSSATLKENSVYKTLPLLSCEPVFRRHGVESRQRRCLSRKFSRFSSNPP